MASLNNSPSSETYLRLEARKSFSLGLWIQDHHGRALDIAGTTLRLVVRKPNFPTVGANDQSNLIANAVADIAGPGVGYAQFRLQASDLDQKPGEYEYSITMLTNGFSSVILKGTLELQQNTEFSSVDSVYTEGEVMTALQVLLKGQHTISVRTGPTLAPGVSSFLDSDKAKLDNIEAGAQVNVPSDWEATDGDAFILNKPEHRLLPAGGGAGSILFKNSNGEGDTKWVRVIDTPGGFIFPDDDLYPSGTTFTFLDYGRGGLDATGIPEGRVPMANGANNWDWVENQSGVTTVNGQSGDVVLDASSLPDQNGKVIMTDAEREKLENLEWIDIKNRPTLGTAAAQNTAYFVRTGAGAASDIVSGVLNNARVPRLVELRGILPAGTASPTGGQDGDFYFQYSV